MRIALINEDSQANKNSLILESLNEISEKYGNVVDNYGMFSETDKHQINYTQVGILASIILETKMADFVVTGCGTGQGAMISCNAFRNVVCGYASTPLDAYLFSQINSGNAISIPFAQQFGWGSEVNLKMLFEHLFCQDFGGGYPKQFADEEKISRVKMCTDIKNNSQKEILDTLRSLNEKELVELLDYKEFKELFIENAKDCEVTNLVKTLLKL